MEKNKHPLDKFFREELKNFAPEPSAAGKEAFMKSAAQVPDVSASRNRRFLLTILILLVAGTLSAVYFLVSPAGSPRNGEEASPQPTGTSAEATNSSPEAPAPSGSLPVASSSSSSSSLLSSLSSSLSSISPISPTSVPTSSLQETPSEHITENSSNQDIFQETQPPPAPLPVPVSPADSVSTDNPILADSVPTEQKRKRTPVERKEQSWLVGAYYTPEWMFNTLEGDKYVNNFGLEGTFRFGRYSVRTGLGLSITRGTNELVIGYNDYLGTYRELDSISFQWDEKHYHLLPTYHLTDQKVWDSLVIQEEQKLIKRYVYLQIPLILGYDFVEKGWFSMGLRAGPVLSLMLSSKQLSANYDPGQDKIVTINQITPDRIQTNWQVMGGINFGFVLNRRLNLELEPEVRYYFNSVYEKSEITKKPWSAGIRAAINFDLKK